MTASRPRPRRTERSILESPVLALLVVIVAGLAGTAYMSTLFQGASATPVPGSTGAAPSPTPTSPGPTFVRPTPSPMPTFVTHAVQPGDTLTSIARQFRTTGRSIAWWNRGAYPSLDPESATYDPNRLEVGWVLHLLPDTVVDENNPPTPSPGPPTAPPTDAPESPAG